MPFRSLPVRVAVPRLVTAAAAVLAAACGASDATAPRAAGSASLSIVLAAGAPASLVIQDARLSLSPGETIQLSAVHRGGRGGTAGVAWSSLDEAVAEVEATGLLRARATGSTVVVARLAEQADTLRVVVTACGAGRTLDLRPGQVETLNANQGDLCLDGGSAGADFAVVAYAAGKSPTTKVSLAIAASGMVAPRAADAGASFGALSIEGAAGVVDGESADGLSPNLAFHRELRLVERRELGARIPEARRAMREARAAGGPLLSKAAAPPKVGDLLRLNVSGDACKLAKAEMRTGRVAAVTQRTVVVADTLNPAGGFTDAEYERFGVTFDTLAYPVNVENFGEPSDIDRNGRVIIFFTSAVNARTPRGATYYVGGFFFSRDLFPSDKSEAKGGCPAGNAAEMFYMLVPDPTGAVNGNRRSKSFVTDITLGTLGHEFQHLVNSSRRLYVGDSNDFEDVWLNEGLSHVAEELMFFRAGGGSPRARYAPAQLSASPQLKGAFAAFGTSNFGRLISFLEKPEGTSPFGDDDELETRGATWHFLRYAADRMNGRDGDLWMRLANSKSTGLANLQGALGGANLDDWFRDWAVSTVADGRGLTALDPRYASRTWDTRAVVSGICRTNPRRCLSFPLATRALVDGRAEQLTLAQGGAAYLELAVAPGRQATLRARNGMAAAPASVKLAVVRVR